MRVSTRRDHQGRDTFGSVAAAVIFTILALLTHWDFFWWVAGFFWVCLFISFKGLSVGLLAAIFTILALSTHWIFWWLAGLCWVLHFIGLWARHKIASRDNDHKSSNAEDPEVSAKRRIQARASTVQENIDRLSKQAVQAFKVGREDLARLAQQRKQAAMIELQSLEDQLSGMEEVAKEEPKIFTILPLGRHSVTVRVTGYKGLFSSFGKNFSVGMVEGFEKGHNLVSGREWRKKRASRNSSEGDQRYFCLKQGCGRELSDGEAFCIACGSPRARALTDSEFLVCGSCHQELAQGAKFCLACGTQVLRRHY